MTKYARNHTCTSTDISRGRCIGPMRPLSISTNSTPSCLPPCRMCFLTENGGSAAMPRSTLETDHSSVRLAVSASDRTKSFAVAGKTARSGHKSAAQRNRFIALALFGRSDDGRAFHFRERALDDQQRRRGHQGAGDDRDRVPAEMAHRVGNGEYEHAAVRRAQPAAE